MGSGDRDMGRIDTSFKIGTVNKVCTVCVLVLGIACVTVLAIGYRQFGELRRASDAFIECESATSELNDACSYLTEQARLCVTTGKMSYADKYFNEVDIVKRREDAVSTLKKRFAHTDAFKSLKQALKQSNDLMQTDLYAMRLVCEASESMPSTWPSAIRQVELDPSDAALDNTQKGERAQQIIMDSNYQHRRDNISTSVRFAGNALVQKTQSDQQSATQKFLIAFRNICLLFALFACGMLGVCLLVQRTVVRPLENYSELIAHGEISPITGSRELRHLAATYNKTYRENARHQMRIRYQAEHDALTKLLNRGSFDEMLAELEKRREPFGLALIDVDTFKRINDGYGHEMGDRVLKRVAKVLLGAFRGTDFVFRFGGDEFAVIMMDMVQDQAGAVADKVAHINDMLLHPTDDLPPVSISVGVATSDRTPAAKPTFTNADSVLYQVKEQGRCGCRIFCAEDDDGNRVGTDRAQGRPRAGSQMETIAIDAEAEWPSRSRQPRS